MMIEDALPKPAPIRKFALPKSPATNSRMTALAKAIATGTPRNIIPVSSAMSARMIGLIAPRSFL